MTTDPDPLVGIIMGSVSDLRVMKTAAAALHHFSVPHEVRILSAHRTPHRMVEYARTASDRGVRVIIAGAGGSAHLPGMSAVETTLPVIGVAIDTDGDALNAALGSMLRMPRGAPLATMGKNETAAWNAGLFAIRVLALSDPELQAKYSWYIQQMGEEVARLDDRLVELGVDRYLEADASPVRTETGGDRAS